MAAATQDAAASTTDEKVDDSNVLFTPIKLGNFELSNRIVMAPLTRGRATEEFIPTPEMALYYEQRSDVGLIITEATGISRQGLGWYRAPGIWNDEQVEKWKIVTNKVHAKGCVISLQLWHMGRQAHSAVTGEQIVSASPIALPGQVTTVKGVKKDYEVPHSPNEEEIKNIIQDYINAASNAKKAGFDLVEIHGANGYLIDQFLQKSTNKRNDKYGGIKIENRLRFMKEVVNGVQTIYPSSQIGIRLSPNGNFGGMGSDDNIETFDEAIKWLSNEKLGYIHIMNGLGFGFHKLCDEYTNERANNIIKKISKDTLLISNVGYTFESGTNDVSKKYTDLIAYGRPIIANPDLVKRFKNGLKLADVAPYDTWWGWKRTTDGYTDWPTYEEEQQQKKDNENAENTAANDDNNKKLGAAKKTVELEPVQAICDLLKDQIKEKSGIKDDFAVFEVTDALSQVVAGTNYFAKVKIDDSKYIHVRIWKKLDQTSHVTKVITDQTKDDELKYF